MQGKSSGPDPNFWILISAFIPNFLLTANGTVFNRHNELAKEALDPYLHVLGVCGLLIVIAIGVQRYRKSN